MENEIKSFFAEIQKKTFIDFVVFDSEGECVFGDKRVGEILPNDVEGVFSDVGLHRTLFKIKIKNNRYTGRIMGAGIAERNYALLITELSAKAFIKEKAFTKEDFLRALIFGELNYGEISSGCTKYSLIDGEACVMLVSYSAGRGKEVINILNNYSSSSRDYAFKIDNTSCAFIKFADEVASEYRSFAEFAEFIVSIVSQEIGVEVFVCLGGTVRSITELQTSFSQAVTTKRMVGADASKASVHSFKEYVLIKLLEDMPQHKVDEYLGLLMDPGAREIFDDEEMVETAEEFLNRSLNQSDTARTLFLHRNTLNYRLDKIEKKTGLNIRKFSDAVTFRLITLLLKLTR